MNDRPLPLSWPAAPRSGAVVVQHPAWEEARNAVLDLVAEGPVTVFLSGEPGTGKTWLLRELAASLSEHGFPTMALLRGDLPVPLGDGVAVLVDEASYMPETTRAELAVQDRGVVVLADIGPFAAHSAGDGRTPVHIHLRLLAAAEIGLFATDWLRQEGSLAATLDVAGLSRLAEHSGGAVRLIAQLLTAAIALTRADGRRTIDAHLIDQVAAFRLGASMPEMAAATSSLPVPPPPVAATITRLAVVVPPTAPSIVPLPDAAIPPPLFPVLAPVLAPRKRVDYRWAMAGTAVAASILVAIVVSSSLSRAPSEVADALPPPRLPAVQLAQMGPAPPVASGLAPSTTSIPIDPAAHALPPLQAANVPAPVAAALASPLVPAAGLPAATLGQTPPQVAAPRIVSPSAAPLPIAIASMPQPTVIPVITTGVMTKGALMPVLAPVPAVARPATTGLVLVAKRGDTLERLYADIYRDRRAPPFGAILAANPTPFKPGAIVVFPEPIGGWARQR